MPQLSNNLNLYQKIRFFLCAIAILFSFVAFGQVVQTLDSLQQILENTEESEERVDLLNSISFQYYDYNDSIGFIYANEAFELSKKLKYTDGEKEARTMMGIGHFCFGRYAEAAKEYRLSDGIRSKKFLLHSVYNLRLLGNILTDLGRVDSAKLVFSNAIKIAHEHELKRELSFLYKSLGRLKINEFDKEGALEDLRIASQFRNQVSDTTKKDIYIALTLVYLEFKDFDKAQENVTKLENSISDSINLYYITYLNLLKADVELKRGNYTKALNFGYKAIEVSNGYKYPFLKIEVLTLFGEIYSELGEYQLATKHYLNALKISEETGLKPFELDIRIELAWIYKDQKNYDQSLEYLNKAENIAKEIKNLKGESTCYNIRGLVFLSQKDYSKSEIELRKALAIRKQIGYEFGEMNVMFNLALLFEDMGRLEEALKIQLEALVIDKRYNQPQSLSMTYNAISSVLIKLNRIDEALRYLDISFENARKAGSLTLLRNSYGNYAKLYESKKDFIKAYNYQKLFQQINDSIYSESSMIKIAEMQALYQVERKQTQIDLLNKEKELQINQIQLGKTKIDNQYFIIVAAVIIFFILVFLIVLIYRFNRNILQSKINLAETNEILQSKQEEIQAQSEELTESNTALAQLNEDLQFSQLKIAKQAEKLEFVNREISNININLELRIEEGLSKLKQAYNELDTFFYRASHDFRRPITTFLGLAEVANITVKDANALHLFSKVKETATNLDRMILKLQSISDVGSKELEIDTINFNEVFEEQRWLYKQSFIDNNVLFETKLDLKAQLVTHPLMITTILRLLIENAIDFKTKVDPKISCTVSTHLDGVNIVVADNGMGIMAEYQSQVFDMYFRASETSKGNGLGLYIVKRAVNRLNGSVSLTSEKGVGTTVTVHIPNLS